MSSYITNPQQLHPLLLSASAYASSTNGVLVVTSESILAAILEGKTTKTKEYLQDIKFPVSEVIRELLALDWVKQPSKLSSTSTSYSPPPSFSPTAEEIEKLATAIAQEKKTANVHTEDFLAALLLHPRSIARHVVETIAPDGFTNEFLSACSLDPHREKLRFLVKELRDAWTSTAQWTHESFRTSSSSSSPSAPIPPLQDDSYNFRGPTRESNVLIPGRVFTGEVPGGWGSSAKITKQCVDDIMSAGVTVFVCLLEFRPDYIVHLEGRADFIHFPIDDFDVADDRSTLAFVEELGRRFRQTGDVFYIHCFSGRGRTGIIASSLLMNLYSEVDKSAAVAICNSRKRIGRTGRTKGGHMPETEEQHEQLSTNEVSFKRGGHKAKANI
ncbi:hypothetical protein TrST_g150 [Triparma strigata]|uniref:Tyrosine specific protein phosphatases domain-containing protein n=1 Tax=Triparma strigata TaxID=1606541 RepID=A0A9W7EZP2_9STRA|nr:hypothetical protein TrST_g150 [Triparma strigata]